MCFGPLRRLCHWGPLTALGIIKIVTLMTIHCNSQWWPPTSSLYGVFNSSSFLLLSTLTLYNFLSSVYEGPGLLPFGWRPADSSDSEHLQFCNVCQGYKAPRSHHCKKCGRCVMKMDHHCPWINNCVGHTNHCHFTLFLFFAVCGCLHSTIVLSCSLYRAIHRSWYLYYGDPNTPIVTLSLYAFVACIFALGLSIGVVLAVGMLLFFQVRAIVRNRTGIEDWILEKANHRRFLAAAHGEELAPFVFPYDLGRNSNIKQVLNWSLSVVGDGVTWQVADGCDQYTLTREQMEQKSEKRIRARPYHCTSSYSGRWLPVVHGWRVLCSPPCSDEYRLPLSPGDSLSVTRWRRHWLFGEQVTGGVLPDDCDSTTPKSPLRGWFPRCCVIEITGDIGITSQTQDKKTD